VSRVTSVHDTAGKVLIPTPASAEPPLRAHVRPFDGLRGLAVLLVAIPHIINAGMAPALSWLPFASGTIAHGVDLFFVLSGFGLAYPFVSAGASAQPLRFDVLTYAFNRLYRILPLYYLTIVLTFVVAYAAIRLGPFTDGAILNLPHGLYEFAAPLLLLDRGNLPVNPGLWTIAVQLRWYVVFPFALMLWLKSPRAFGVALVWVWVAYLFTRERTVDLGTLPLFLLGIVAAAAIVRGHRNLRYAVLALPVAIAGAIAWDPHAMIQDSWGVDNHFAGQPTSFAWHIVCFLLVISVATIPLLQRTFSLTPLRAVGRASFSIYLVHQPVLALTFALAGTGLAAGVTALTGSLAAGFVFWWCFERPLTDAGRRRALRERALPMLRRGWAWLGLAPVVVLERRAVPGRTTDAA
jgi:peptidoglycan/LPS O-acetylase OafA/YrhL